MCCIFIIAKLTAEPCALKNGTKSAPSVLKSKAKGPWGPDQGTVFDELGVRIRCKNMRLQCSLPNQLTLITKTQKIHTHKIEPQIQKKLFKKTFKQQH